MARRLNVALKPNAGLPFHVVLPSIALRSRKDAVPDFHINRDTTDLVMNYSHRFLLPFFPVLLIAAGVIVDAGVRSVHRCRAERPLRFRLLVALTILLAVMQLLSYRRELRAELAYVSWYMRLMEDEHVQAGKFIRARVPEGEWLAVLYDAGAIPYYSGLPTVDFGGLNDHTVVKLARSGSSRGLVEYFYSLRPGVAVFTSVEPDRIVHLPLSTEILTDPRVQRLRPRAGI